MMQDTIISIKEDKYTSKILNEIDQPVKNIAYSLLPISLAAGKGNIKTEDFLAYSTKYNKLLLEIKQLEKESVELLVNNNVGNISSISLTKIIENKKAQKKSKNKAKENKKVKLLQISNSKQEKEKTILINNTNSNLALKDTKTLDEWKVYAQTNKINLGTAKLKDAVYEIIREYSNN